VQARLLSVVTILTILTLLTFALVIGPEVALPTGCLPFPTHAPANPSDVRDALRSEHRARDAREALCRVRRCLGDSAPVRVAARPLRGANLEAWQDAARRWQRQARDWREKARAGVVQMRRPGGSGAARWKALALYAGWSRATWPTLRYLITLESGGDPAASNGGVYLGLLQVWRGHVANPSRLTDPEVNLRVGLRLYREGGWGPWGL
jgi:hypothetical protein